MKSYQALLIPFGPHLSMRIYVMWLIIESICSTYVIKSSPEHLPVCLSAQLSVCLLHAEFSNLQIDLCVGFCSSLQDKSIPQRTQTLK